MRHLRRGVLFVLGLAFFSAVAASPLKAGVIMVSPTAFDLGDTFINHKYLAFDQYLSMISWDPNYSNTPAFFYAPLNLPQGAALKRFIIYCLDDSDAATDYVTVAIKRVNVLTGAAEYVASLSTVALAASSDHAALITKSLAHRVVNNKQYTYCLEVQFPPLCTSLVQLCGVRIEW